MAWMMLHQLRRAMVNVSRDQLHGEIEVDDSWVGGEQAGLEEVASSKTGERRWSWWPSKSEAKPPVGSAWR